MPSSFCQISLPQSSISWPHSLPSCSKSHPGRKPKQNTSATTAQWRQCTLALLKSLKNSLVRCSLTSKGKSPRPIGISARKTSSNYVDLQKVTRCIITLRSILLVTTCARNYIYRCTDDSFNRNQNSTRRNSENGQLTPNYPFHQWMSPTPRACKDGWLGSRSYGRDHPCKRHQTVWRYQKDQRTEWQRHSYRHPRECHVQHPTHAARMERLPRQEHTASHLCRRLVKDDHHEARPSQKHP